MCENYTAVYMAVTIRINLDKPYRKLLRMWVIANDIYCSLPRRRKFAEFIRICARFIASEINE
jgi:hypothetical protein